MSLALQSLDVIAGPHCDIHFTNLNLAVAFMKMLAGQIPVDWFMETVRRITDYDSDQVNSIRHMVEACVGAGI